MSALLAAIPGELWGSIAAGLLALGGFAWRTLTLRKHKNELVTAEQGGRIAEAAAQRRADEAARKLREQEAKRLQLQGEHSAAAAERAEPAKTVLGEVDIDDLIKRGGGGGPPS